MRLFNTLAAAGIGVMAWMGVDVDAKKAPILPDAPAMTDVADLSAFTASADTLHDTASPNTLIGLSPDGLLIFGYEVDISFAEKAMAGGIGSGAADGAAADPQSNSTAQQAAPDPCPAPCTSTPGNPGGGTGSSSAPRKICLWVADPKSLVWDDQQQMLIAKKSHYLIIETQGGSLGLITNDNYTAYIADPDKYITDKLNASVVTKVAEPRAIGFTRNDWNNLIRNNVQQGNLGQLFSGDSNRLALTAEQGAIDIKKPNECPQGWEKHNGIPQLRG